MEKEEKELVIYEEMIKYKYDDFETRLTLTNKKILFERKKGLFKKVYKIIDCINLDDIKIINNKIIVGNDNENVIIETNDSSYKFSCENESISKKIVSKIIDDMTGKNIFQRTGDKIITIGKETAKVVGAVGSIAVTIGIGIKKIRDNKEIILEGISDIKSFIGK